MTIPRDDVALGVTVFKRTEKLRALLESAEGTVVGRVYVADDGDTADRADLYAEEFDFDLDVIDLPYDAGLGRGRQQLVKHLEEEYLLVTDSDHRIPDNVGVLIDQIEADPDLGGVGGLFLEHGHLSGMCHDIYEDDGLLIRDTPPEKHVRTLAGHPFVEFDFIPNVAVFRRECLEDYTWDPEYVIGKEHLDFYVGHHRTTDWNFGVCPRVLFPHDPGGDDDFLDTRHDPSRLLRSKQYFLEKWGYDQVLREHYWLDLAHGMPVMIGIARALPRALQPDFLDLNDALWRFQGKTFDAVGDLLQ